MKSFKFQALILLIGVALFNSCSTTKSVPEGEYLYTGARVDLGDNKKLATKKLVEDVYSVLSPKPNDKLFGLPLRLYLYNFFDNGKEKGLFPWVRDKIGQPPVLFKKDYPQEVDKLIENRLFNNGFYTGTVDHEVTLDEKKASVRYLLHFEEPYHIDSISNRITHPEIGPLISSMPPSKVLQPGDVYTLAGLKAEAQRIENFVREQGYYFFSADYLKFQVDSTNRDRTVDLRLLLRDNVPPRDLRKSYIRVIDVWTDHGSESSKLLRDDYQGIRFLHWTTPNKLRPRPLSSHILFRPGDVYNVEYHHNTLKRLINLRSLSFVNITYNRPENTDSLEMEVMLSPRTPQTIQGSFGLSYKNSQYLGPELELTYINHNLFRGSENLRIRGYTNLNFPIGSNAVGRFYENSGVETELLLPGLRTPWRRQRKNLTRASTKLNLRYERARTDIEIAPFLVVPGFEDLINGSFPDLAAGLAQDSAYAPSIGVNSIKFTFGYQWQQRPEIFHEFNPVGLGLQLDHVETPDLKRFLSLIFFLVQDYETLIALEDMIYWNPDYILLYDSRNQRVKRNNYFYRGRVSFTGNHIVTSKAKELFNVDEFQSYFAQSENDFRYFYITPKKKHTLAFRFIANLSLPFGKELFLPFLNLYTVGGPNSVRAYSLRELGPGTVRPDSVRNTLWLYAGKGDLHLESSLEFRYKMTKMFELAFFADAGNVWLLKGSTDAVPGKGDPNFYFNNFYKELGFGAGLGLRLNINPLVLRLDLAVPFTKPWLPEGERWVANQIDIFDGGWRRDNLSFNLSFGYPF